MYAGHPASCHAFMLYMYENEYSKNSYDGLPGNIPRGTCVAWTDPCHLRLGIKADFFARQV